MKGSPTPRKPRSSQTLSAARTGRRVGLWYRSEVYRSGALPVQDRHAVVTAEDRLARDAGEEPRLDHAGDALQPLLQSRGVGNGGEGAIGDEVAAIGDEGLA